VDDRTAPPSVTTLPDRWVRDVGAAGASAAPAAVRAAYADVAERYHEPPRRYHTLSHVAAVLETVDELVIAATGDAPERFDRHAVVLAAWLHDVVYDPTRAGNEAASAALAGSLLTPLGIPSLTVVETQRLIETTARHDATEDDVAASILGDADLAILGASPAVYARYVEGVREEYRHVPDEAFARGRSAVLEAFLDRPRLFHTASLHDRLEPAARANVRSELDRLRRVGTT
jgi:predicted metal-dependent HD superfamily phosphohydrolase